ncbi:MAG TPA: hypothetical protein DHV28_12565 [Ignavibacteriales bacterium]|nr:hypothetical protein [Ignavibacteriales bacterium]
MTLKRKSKVLLIIVSVLAFIFISGLIGGCSSSVLAPALSEEEEAIVEHAHLNFVVGVEESNPKIYADKLITSLRRTNLFKQVDYINNLSGEPDIIAKVNENIYGSAVIPIFTAITLGFFPTWVEEEHGNSFILQWKDNMNKTINVRSVYSGYTVLGWISGLLNILPDRTSSESISHPRYTARLAYDIVRTLN